MGCRKVACTSDLVRVARTPDGELAVSGVLPGRGAWLCRGSRACVTRAVKAGAFSRALRAELAPGASQRLEAYLVASVASGEAGALVCEDGTSSPGPFGSRKKNSKGS